jgi:hypothetical protein
MKKSADTFMTVGTSTPVRFSPAEMDDAGVVYLTCEHGHQTATVYRNRKHQVLFDSGCLALLEDYTNEAVSSFFAALERAYEFFIRVAYRKLGVSSSLLESSWKQIAAQSERQFGGFVLLFPIVAGESFDLPKKIPELRNKVIHRGYIAQSKEVLDYAETIFLLIRKIVQVLNDKCPTEMWAEINEAAELQKKNIPEGMEWTWMMTSEFDLERDLTFEAWLTRLKEKFEPPRRSVV